MIFANLQESESDHVKWFEKAILIHQKKRFEEETKSKTFLRESGSLPDAPWIWEEEKKTPSHMYAMISSFESKIHISDCCQ